LFINKVNFKDIQKSKKTLKIYNLFKFKYFKFKTLTILMLYEHKTNKLKLKIKKKVNETLNTFIYIKYKIP